MSVRHLFSCYQSAGFLFSVLMEGVFVFVCRCVSVCVCVCVCTYEVYACVVTTSTCICNGCVFRGGSRISESSHYGLGLRAQKDFSTYKLSLSMPNKVINYLIL